MLIPQTWPPLSVSGRLAQLDEALFEVGHLLARLTAVDGAVVLTKRFEVLGCGGEISGAQEPGPPDSCALDAEGEQREAEGTEGVGTRHRSVYRLRQALHEVVAIVVSQDGAVRFVTWQEGAATSWDQVATSVIFSTLPKESLVFRACCSIATPKRSSWSSAFPLPR